MRRLTRIWSTTPGLMMTRMTTRRMLRRIPEATRRRRKETPRNHRRKAVRMFESVAHAKPIRIAPVFITSLLIFATLLTNRLATQRNKDLLSSDFFLPRAGRHLSSSRFFLDNFSTQQSLQHFFSFFTYFAVNSILCWSRSSVDRFKFIINQLLMIIARKWLCKDRMKT